ncbi:phage tail protein [Escherichia coli]|uniref:phage tail protein n=1 Tax=Escherichia coli TaxID=562 RepID=UPI002019F397|nr:phage tail protein [Escherichia coli]
MNNALALKAPLSSPALTGTPTAPTAAQSVNNTQIATTAFVKSAIAAMVGSAPAALDTLNELAAALGNDPNFSTTVLNALADKQPLDNTLTNLSGKDVAGLLAYLGLGEGAPAIGVPFFWPSAAMPNTVIDSWSGMVFLKFNGAKFSASDYPVLAKVFPSLVLPEARGDFIRIWDDGRGADGGRELLSWQAATNFSQFAGNIGEGAGHAINFHDGIAGNQPGFSRFNFTSNSVGDGVNFVAVRPRNIAFNFLVRAK